MKSIKATIMGRHYPLKVEDHEEALMLSVCAFVDKRFEQYRKQLAKQPESTIMVLAALSIAEELFEEKRKNMQLLEAEDKTLERINKKLEAFLEEMEQ